MLGSASERWRASIGEAKRAPRLVTESWLGRIMKPVQHQTPMILSRHDSVSLRPLRLIPQGAAPTRESGERNKPSQLSLHRNKGSVTERDLQGFEIVLQDGLRRCAGQHVFNQVHYNLPFSF